MRDVRTLVATFVLRCVEDAAPYTFCGRTMFAPTECANGWIRCVVGVVPYNKIGNLSTHIKHPQKCNLTNLSICEERTHKGCQGCPLVTVIKLRDQFGHFASFVQA